MYAVGELIVYGGSGVCKVIEVKEFGGRGPDAKRLFYVLKPLYQECTITAPVDSDKVFIRPIISREEAERLIDTIPHIVAEPCDGQAVRQLSERYEASIKSHNVADLLELTMSIHAKKEMREKQNRKFGAVDERFMKRAEELLFGELSAALGIDKEEIPAYIASRVE